MAQFRCKVYFQIFLINWIEHWRADRFSFGTMNLLYTEVTWASFKTDEIDDDYIYMLAKFKLKGENKYIFYKF